ncbi:MAG: sodium:solute symporter family protein [Alphaproteobacteria bacterium]|nr:sodium:solute symporter family protein [Alphaproteobacteria bacterium]
MSEGILDTSGIIAIFGYLLSLLLIGWWANKARQSSSLNDYYLAGGSVGTTAMFFTLYATQYSGNTLFAIPGAAYRGGFIGLSVVVAITAVVLVYFTYAPHLNRLAKKHEFVSLGDFISWRFDSKPLLIAVNLIAIFTLMTYALGNFKAVGLLLETASGGAISFAAGIMILAVVMAIYESLGGLRGVIWTDMLQGSLLFLGCLLLFGAVFMMNGPDSITNPEVLVRELASYFRDDMDAINFFSIVILIALGAAVYPQAIQRIYIAKDETTLKRSYAPLLLMPVLTTLPMILVGISVAEWLPDLPDGQTENVVIYAVNHITGQYPSLSWLLILYLGAAVAAIMSTIDSAMLTLGSIVTKDMVEKSQKDIEPEALFKISRYTSLTLMIVMAVLAILLPQSIWTLLIFKFEFLIQIAPAVILGTRSSWIESKGTLWGLAAGCACALLLKLLPILDLGPAHLAGIHAGLWGLAVNLLVLLIIGTRTRKVSQRMR